MAFITLAGVSIGLGNVWRFPYMMGQHGGAAFLLLYGAMIVLIAMPALAIEWGLGRHARGDAIAAYRQAFGRAGLAVGAVLVVGIAVADSYYMVVIGNIAYSTVFSITQGFSASTMDGYAAGLSSGWTQYAFALAILGAGLLVTARGLHAGIEGVSRLFVPLFGVVVIYLVAQTLLLPGAMTHIADFMRPDFSRIGPTQIFAAMGQACFSVGLGGTLMVVYGTHIGNDQRLLPLAAATAFTDLGAALMAGLFIVPAVLVFGLGMNAGPGLLFATLPELFSSMPGARVAGSAFLLALTLMAFLSALAGLHVLFRALASLGIARWQAIAVIGIVEAALMIPSSHSTDVIGMLDLWFGSGMQMVGALCAVLAVCWGLGRLTLASVFDGVPGRWRVVMAWWARWLIPCLLLAILAGYIAEQVRG